MIANEDVSESKSAPAGWLKSLNCDRGYGAALLAVLLLLGVLAATGRPGLYALRFERAGLLHGEWWRLVSGHVVHLGARHLLLDGAALVLLWVLYARALRWRHWLGVLLAALVAIDAGLWWLSPQVQWYAGISGLLHAAWSAGAVAGARRGEVSGWLLLVLLAGKLAWEQYAGASLLVAQFPVVVDAHLYGALGALPPLLALVLARKSL